MANMRDKPPTADISHFLNLEKKSKLRQSKAVNLVHAQDTVKLLEFQIFDLLNLRGTKPLLIVSWKVWLH